MVYVLSRAPSSVTSAIDLQKPGARTGNSQSRSVTSIPRKASTEVLAPLPVQPTISQKSRTSASGAVTFGLWLAAISK